MSAHEARTQLRDEAEAHIREMIVGGRARPGQLLRLAPLADDIGASITPVREALLLLAKDGWVIQEPNRGFRVAPIRRADIEDAYFIHCVVAGELAARAACKADERALAPLRELDGRIQAIALDAADHLAEELNYAFHAGIYAIADSPRLVWFVTAASRFVPRRYWGTIPGWLDVNREDHALILDAVASGDADAARDRMSAHIGRARDVLLAYLDGIGFWTPDADTDGADGLERAEIARKEGSIA
jgi:DNA-binding GntR family transcriptional regulator